MKRRLLALGLGVALPTMLLGFGWLRASAGEREAQESEQRARLVHSAETILAAVDEGLEELRRGEDARPFYLYNHFYSPPQVLAFNDPVAITPLARTPSDPRIVGFFQIDPDGTLRTPYTVTPDDAPTERSRAIVALLARPEFAELRDLTREPAEEPTLLAAAVLPSPEPGPEAEAPPPRRRARRRRQPAASESSPPAVAAPDADSAPDAGSAPLAAVPLAAEPVTNALAPQGPLTVTLNTWGQDVYTDIQAAQAGSSAASSRVQARGRTAPLTRRTNVQWDSYGAVSQQQQSVARNPAQLVPSEAAAEEPRVQPSPRRRRRVRSSNRPSTQTTPPAVAAPTPVGPTLTNMTQQEAEVGYTDMAWYELGHELLLHRIVSHGGAAVVQGVVLDREELVGRWLPALIGRHVTAPAPRIVMADDDSRCALRRPVSTVLSGVELCYPATSLASATAAMDLSQGMQLGALLGLLLIIGFALVVFDRAARRSEELARQKSAFVSAVSHELRTPLTTIRMHAEMLEEGLVSDARRPRVYGELVHEAVRLARLVDNVLEISRLEEGQRPLRAERRDLGAHVVGVVAGYRPFVERKGFTVVGPVNEEAIELSFDGQALEQIVVNLVDNALKYAAEGHPEIDVSLTTAGGFALLRVRDHGPGIPQADRERVFERFQRVDRPETAHQPGTGIGLSLVRDLAEAHGGHVLVREAEGGGAEVEVALPLAAP